MNTLCKQLNFRVNSYPILLGEEFDKDTLKNHKFKKAGFLFRSQLKAEPDQVIWWAKNCELEYLDKQFGDKIFPVTDWRAGAEIMYGTSALLWYKNNRITKFIFQIIQNKIAAKMHLKTLEEKLLKTLGEPNMIKAPFVSWEFEKQSITLEYPLREPGFIHLMLLP